MEDRPHSTPEGKPESDQKIEQADEGPLRWLPPVIESAYSRLAPREQELSEQEIVDAESLAATRRVSQPGDKYPLEATPFVSHLQPGRGGEILAAIKDDYWVQRLGEYQQRKATAAPRLVNVPGMPAIPGVNNWLPIGPAVVAQGQAVGRPAVAGRVGRIAISSDGNRLYAATANGGVFRSDDAGHSWYSLMDGFDLDPNNFASTSLACGAIAINPVDPDRVYVGTGEGDTDDIFKRRLISALPSYRGVGPIRSDDGGLTWASEVSIPSLAGKAFYALAVDPAGIGAFEGRNTGLSCLCTNYMGMSLSEPAIIYCGMQDNGTARYLGEELWTLASGGDGGYCVVHPTNPFRVLVYANGEVYRTSTGWISDGEKAIKPPWSLMTEPLVGAPASERVAFGAGGKIYVSDDFGNTWPDLTAPSMTLPIGSAVVYSMVFANDNRLFIGTTNGRVFRADLTAGVWSLTRLDNIVSGALPFFGPVADIAIDWSDSTSDSIYICFGGIGDIRHVWQFDGSTWQARSGSGTNSLIDVEHNAIVVDPANPTHIYVGADLGVWHSADSGNTWVVLQSGLPDAPVFDLQIHAAARLLRASTHGRGLYEYPLDSPLPRDTELYIRDTLLDTARGENTDGRNDPSIWPTAPVAHNLSPNIKVDVPTPAGYQTSTNQIDFFQFHEAIVDGSTGVATIDPPAVVHNRVYVLIHNRGPLTAPTVNVTAAVTNASTALNSLPEGYAASIQAGDPLPGSDWTTLGMVELTNLRPGFPQVAAFDLPSNVLPLPASLPGQSHCCLVAFVHSDTDPYTSTERQVDPLTIQERKIGQKNLDIVQFIGTPPEQS